MKNKQTDLKSERFSDFSCEELQEVFHNHCDRIDSLKEGIKEVLLIYMYSDAHEVKLTKKEAEKIIDKCEFLNKLPIEDSKDTRIKFLRYLVGDIDLLEDGTVILKNLSDTGIPVFKKTKTPQYVTEDELETITPLYVKEFIKEKKWTYKDLAEAIGAGESTLKAWISKGEIPEWAKRTILLMQKIDTLMQEKNEAQSESYIIKERLQDFKKLLNDI